MEEHSKAGQTLAQRGAVSLSPSSIALAEVKELAKELQISGLFPGITSPAQAVAKILMGHELGIGPVTALQLIDVVKGRLRPRAQLVATLLKRSGRYDYTVPHLDDQGCTVIFTDRGKEVFKSTWTMDDARRAGVVKPDSGWVTYPKEMLFARALSTGATKVCPEVLSGYEPLEGNGFEVVEGEMVPEGAPPASTWAWFWVRAKELGYAGEEGEDVHEALGVASVKGWLDQGKTLEEALTVLQGARVNKVKQEQVKAGAGDFDLWEGKPKAPPPPGGQAETPTLSPSPALAIEGFYAAMKDENISQAKVCELLTVYERAASGDRGVTYKTLQEWLAPGGTGRTLAKARDIVFKGLGKASPAEKRML